MALEQLVNGMTGQQLANTIKNNFDKVLDVESAENKAENAGKALKTDYDATRYVEMELADGTPIRMRWDVFCQAIASVVAGQMGVKFIERYRVEAGSDFNSLINSGQYLIVGVNTNSPTSSGTYGNLIVFRFGTQYQVTQMFFSQAGELYYRTSWDGTALNFTRWKIVS